MTRTKKATACEEKAIKILVALLLRAAHNLFLCSANSCGLVVMGAVYNSKSCYILKNKFTIFFLSVYLILNTEILNLK
jgi:hypothetical protein